MKTNWNELKPIIIFGSDDVFGTYETMKANGFEILDAPKEIPWGTFVQFKDEEMLLL